MNRIYVTGHRNPDTDSIAAAISYAALRNALGNRDYVAAHLGHISDETKRLLDRFGFQEPVTISNVRTQVRDLDFDTPPALNSSVTMDRAWHIMRDQDISAMPIINEDGTLYGMLSAGDIAAYSMRTISDRHVDALPLFNLLSVIEGRILNDGAEQVDRVSGVVTIALPQSCDNLLFSDPDSIILCGNQPDMIRRALDIGVQCIILCQTDVDPAWLENAGKTCVISTPLDASRVARLVYQAIPISRPCNTEDLVSFHLDDYIDDVREVVLESRYRCYPVLDENEKVVGTLSRYHLLRPRRKRVVLVDHNEMAQAVPGLEQAEILEIIDHHRLADIQTTQPIRVRNEPVGSTTTIITNMYQEHGVMPSPNMAGLPFCPTRSCSSPPRARSATSPWPSVWPASPTSRSRSWATCSLPPRARATSRPTSCASPTSRSSTSPTTISASVRSRRSTRPRCLSARTSCWPSWPQSSSSSTMT